MLTVRRIFFYDFWVFMKPTDESNSRFLSNVRPSSLAKKLILTDSECDRKLNPSVDRMKAGIYLIGFGEHLFQK